MWLQSWSVSVLEYLIVQWPWIGIIDIWHMWSSTCIIYSETWSSYWMKIFDSTLESGHENWYLINICTIKEVSYMECHQARRSSTQTTTVTCPITWIKVLRSNMMDQRMTIGHWCKPLTYTRYPTDNDNGNKDTEWRKTSVNVCVEVKHLRESINHGTLMYSQICQWWENLPLMTIKLKELNGI